MWESSIRAGTTDYVIGDEVWQMLRYSPTYVTYCGFDRRWFLKSGPTACAERTLSACMDIARKPDGTWWLVDRYANDMPPADNEITGPFKSEDDARAAMWILIATTES